VYASLDTIAIHCRKAC